MRDRPLLAAVLGALVIAFSAILVRLAEVSPATAAFFRCAYALPLLGLLETPKPLPASISESVLAKKKPAEPTQTLQPAE